MSTLSLESIPRNLCVQARKLVRHEDVTNNLKGRRAEVRCCKRAVSITCALVLGVHVISISICSDVMLMAKCTAAHALSSSA